LVSTPRDVIDHEHILDDAELAQELAELLVFGMRQVGVTRRDALERQQVDVGEPLVLPSGLLLTPSSNATMPGIFPFKSRKALVTCAILSGVASFLYLKTTTWRTGPGFWAAVVMGVSRIDETRVNSAKCRNERGIGPPEKYAASSSSELVVASFINRRARRSGAHCVFS
jgi:hypothetical protein